MWNFYDVILPIIWSDLFMFLGPLLLLLTRFEIRTKLFSKNKFLLGTFNVLLRIYFCEMDFYHTKSPFCEERSLLRMRKMGN